MNKEPRKEEMLNEVDFLVRCADKIDRPHSFIVNAIRRLIENQPDEDCLCCPRCCKIFHDDDIVKNPEKYWTCPLCSTIQHKECRHPLDDDIEIRHLIESQPEVDELFCETWRRTFDQLAHSLKGLEISDIEKMLKEILVRIKGNYEKC